MKISLCFQIHEYLLLQRRYLLLQRRFLLLQRRYLLLQRRFLLLLPASLLHECRHLHQQFKCQDNNKFHIREQCMFLKNIKGGEMPGCKSFGRIFMIYARKELTIYIVSYYSGFYLFNLSFYTLNCGFLKRCLNTLLPWGRFYGKQTSRISV